MGEIKKPQYCYYPTITKDGVTLERVKIVRYYTRLWESLFGDAIEVCIYTLANCVRVSDIILITDDNINERSPNEWAKMYQSYRYTPHLKIKQKTVFKYYHEEGARKNGTLDELIKQSEEAIQESIKYNEYI